MIKKDEIESKALEFNISIPDVERDYIYSWLLCGIYSISSLKDVLVLKGGNAFRKAYFENTRFSSDLDFSTVNRLDQNMLSTELNKVCDFIEQAAGVVFDKSKNTISEKNFSNDEIKFYELRLYFNDFYGEPGAVLIRIKLDITEFDKIYLPVQTKVLIHPYSDVNDCSAEIKCQKAEEMLAAKLKCLLQRQHSFDLFDLIYTTFFNQNLTIDRSEVLSTFLKKTIFGRNPGVAAKLLLGTPIQALKGAWERYLICPKNSLFSFETAADKFTLLIKEIFGEIGATFAEKFFYPSHLRNMILEAGSKTQLLEVSYKGYNRVVEPYSLTYKRRKDGHAEEYFYVWDRSGGSSRPGIKTLLNAEVESMKLLEEKFDPRYPIELSKAGEMPREGYFAKSNFENSNRIHRLGTSTRSFAKFTIECVVCGKRFSRTKFNTTINKHTNPQGYNCPGRRGILT